ncbi:MAG TPA: DUF1990 domain-containing protein [Thermoanaerobaculia bacterium]|nr:DUF1990 domain-containing protein [Thermoanaerobaculia bacterium]
MILSLGEPSPERVRSALAGQERRELTYAPAGGTRDGARPAGFDHDHNRAEVGHGEEDFAAARAALAAWEMFPRPWTRVAWAGEGPAPIAEGTVVAPLIRAAGLWWLNAGRIVYTLDEDGPVRRFGFAYGTLPGHVERGEERFSVELRPDGGVWYDVLAFSRPRHPLARLGYPLARRLQRRFVRESQAALGAAVAARRGAVGRGAR